MKKSIRLVLAVGLLLVSALPGWCLTIEEIPDPLSTKHSHFMDMAQVIDDAAERDLDKALFDLEASNGTQVAVVAVPEIDGRSPKAFATALFNRWGVGQKGVDNGVLVLLVMNQRRVEIEVGDGANRFLTNSKCDQILQNRAVPYFKKGDYSDGMSNVVRAICTELGTVKYRSRSSASSTAGARMAALKKLPGWEKQLLEPLMLDDNYLSDSVGLLSDSQRLELKHMARVLKEDNGTVLAVLTVKGQGSIWDKPELFYHHWQAAQPAESRGVFLLFNLKKSDIFVGVGKECKAFVSWDKLKEAKERSLAGLDSRDNHQGLYLLAKELADQLRTVDYDRKVRVPLAQVASVRQAQAAHRQPQAFAGGGSPRGHRSSGVNWLSLVAGGGTLFAGLLVVRSYFRNKPRVCRCGQVMDRLAESSEDEFLDSGQQAEENAASVDYDVWLCSACGERKIERYSSWFSSVKKCPACSYRTLRVTRETVESPTTYSEGRGRQEERCSHCRHHDVSYYSIARLPEPTSSDSSSSYSSSSSDSSWGEGSSHGGGSGASW